MLRRLHVPLPVLALVAVVVVMFLVGFADHRQRSLVDWGSARVVAIHSDDWGFHGLLPGPGALDGLDLDALGGTRFPEVYWRSTLEDSADVAELTAVLARHRGRDGLPAVWQPNLIMDRTRAGYDRPGLGEALAGAEAAGVWHQELHGAWHFDPEVERASLDTGQSDVLEAARRGVVAFPDAYRAYELHPDRPWDAVVADWTPDLLARFRDETGRNAVSVIAPDYVWDDRHEDLWRGLGLRAVQAKREQRRLDRTGHGLLKRLRHGLDVRLAYLTRPDLRYIERNCRFETAQHDDPESVLARCLADVRAAWRRGDPAVVETHRVNVVQVERARGREGRDLLDRLLAGIDDGGPLYVSDAEIVDLAARGASAVFRGGRWTVRNPGRAARLVVFTAHDGTPRWCPAPPRTTLVLDSFGASILERHPLD